MLIPTVNWNWLFYISEAGSRVFNIVMDAMSVSPIEPWKKSLPREYFNSDSCSLWSVKNSWKLKLQPNQALINWKLYFFILAINLFNCNRFFITFFNITFPILKWNYSLNVLSKTAKKRLGYLFRSTRLDFTSHFSEIATIWYFTKPIPKLLAINSTFKFKLYLEVIF